MKVRSLSEEKIRKKLEHAIRCHKSLCGKKVVTLSQALDKIILQQMKKINNRE